MSSNRFLFPFFQGFVAATGNVGAGWKLNFYQSGQAPSELARQATYSDAVLTTANANPVVADGNGRWSDIFLLSQQYNVVMTDENDVVLSSADPVSSGMSSDTFTKLHERYSSAAGQTVINTVTPFTLSVSGVELHINGVLLGPPDYTKTNTTTITLRNAITTAGQTIDIYIPTSINLVAVLAQQVEYTPTWTGAVASDVRTRLGYAVFLNSFAGADPTGVSLSDTAMSNFISFINTNKRLGFFFGKFKLSAKYTLSAKCTLSGFGYSENSGNGSASELLKVSTYSGTLLEITSPAVALKNFGIEGESGNGGNGITVLANATCLEDISSHNQGGDGIRYGTDTGGGANCNFSQGRNLICHGNDGHGIKMSQPDGVGSSDCNAGNFNGVFVQGNGDEGLSIDYAAANTFTGLLAQSNTSFGVGLKANSSQNQFYGGDINENNDGGVYDLDIEAGAEQNSLHWTAVNPAKVNDLGTETMIVAEDYSNVINYLHETNSVQTGTTTLPFDDSIPQSTEGDEYISFNVTRQWGVTDYLIEAKLHLSSTVANRMIAALFKDSETAAISCGTQRLDTADEIVCVTLGTKITAASGTTNFKIRAGGSAAGTTTLNGRVSGRMLGGVISSTVSITQVRAN